MQYYTVVEKSKGTDFPCFFQSLRTTHINNFLWQLFTCTYALSLSLSPPHSHTHCTSYTQTYTPLVKGMKQRKENLPFVFLLNHNHQAPYMQAHVCTTQLMKNAIPTYAKYFQSVLFVVISKISGWANFSEQKFLAASNQVAIYMGNYLQEEW